MQAQERFHDDCNSASINLRLGLEVGLEAGYCKDDTGTKEGLEGSAGALCFALSLVSSWRLCTSLPAAISIWKDNYVCQKKKKKSMVLSLVINQQSR